MINNLDKPAIESLNIIFTHLNCILSKKINKLRRLDHFKLSAQYIIMRHVLKFKRNNSDIVITDMNWYYWFSMKDISNLTYHVLCTSCPCIISTNLLLYFDRCVAFQKTILLYLKEKELHDKRLTTKNMSKHGFSYQTQKSKFRL